MKQAILSLKCAKSMKNAAFQMLRLTSRLKTVSPSGLAGVRFPVRRLLAAPTSSAARKSPTSVSRIATSSNTRTIVAIRILTESQASGTTYSESVLCSRTSALTLCLTSTSRSTYLCQAPVKPAAESTFTARMTSCATNLASAASTETVATF